MQQMTRQQAIELVSQACTSYVNALSAPANSITAGVLQLAVQTLAAPAEMRVPLDPSTPFDEE